MPINWSTKIVPTPVVGNIVGQVPSDHKIAALRSGSPPDDNKWLSHQWLASSLRAKNKRGERARQLKTRRNISNA